MHGVKANARVGIQDAGIGNLAVEHRAVAIPTHPPLTAAAHYFPPQPEEPVPEPPERRAVSRHRMVLVVAALTLPSHSPTCANGSCIRRRSSCFNCCSFARIRLPAVLRHTMKRPFLNPQ